MINIFIDTNIFLSFYHLSSDDLEELRKLSTLLEEQHAKLYLPEQVSNEFQRNRQAKIADGMKRLREQRLNLQFPQICKDYPQYETLRNLQKQYEKTHNELIDTLTKHIDSQDLRADRIIGELFDEATRISCTLDLIKKARLRVDVGNPPGKRGSLGDAINWESLLDTVPRGQDIHFITGDSDFFSPLNDATFDSFLSNEWGEQKRSELFAYRRLSEFFRAQFPQIKLATEARKDLLITRLNNSGSFATTHEIVAKLRQFSDFSSDQINAIISAAALNSQVRWIITDADVAEFLTELIQGREEEIDEEYLGVVQEYLEDTDTVTEDDIPF